MLRAALLALAVATAVAAPEIRVVNEAGLAEARIAELLTGFRGWAVRVERYLQVDAVAPINLVFTERAGPGLYIDDRILMPPDDDPEEMEETWIHEFTHHVSGHDSTFFLKEGFATHVLEKLFAEDHRVPQGWPQYGASNDDWVRLFAARGQLLPLAQALARPGYDGSSRDGDYRSWQVYAQAGSFVGWYVRRYGIAEFMETFHRQRPRQPIEPLEREWLATLARNTAPLIDPAQQLPQGPRYQDFARRLAAAAR